MSLFNYIFCNHEYISLGKYYDIFEGDLKYGIPTTYVYIYEPVKCRKCQKIKHPIILKKKFIGWNDNIEYQQRLLNKDIPKYDDWVLSF